MNMGLLDSLKQIPSLELRRDHLTGTVALLLREERESKCGRGSGSLQDVHRWSGLLVLTFVLSPHIVQWWHVPSEIRFLSWMLSYSLLCVSFTWVTCCKRSHVLSGPGTRSWSLQPTATWVYLEADASVVSPCGPGWSLDHTCLLGWELFTVRL